jgi:hypothetical protein
MGAGGGHLFSAMRPSASVRCQGERRARTVVVMLIARVQAHVRLGRHGSGGRGEGGRGSWAGAVHGRVQFMGDCDCDCDCEYEV